MKTVAVIAIQLAACGAGWTPPAVAQASSQLSAEVKSCIKSNAPIIEQTIQSLNEATEFLTGKLCAEPIAQQVGRQQAEESKKIAEAQQARMKALCEKQTNVGKPDNSNGSSAYIGMICDPTLEVADDEMWFPSMTLSETYFTPPPPSVVSFAAQTLLSLRLKKLNLKP